PVPRMSFEAQSLLGSLPPPSWHDFAAALGGPGVDRPGALDPALLDADAADVAFELDPRSVDIHDRKTDQWNTRYEARGELTVRGPRGVATQVPVRYEVTLRNEEATPAAMASVNPFDP